MRRNKEMKLTLNVSLAGKTAVITGAGGVICDRMAKVLAEAGANVAVLDINETAAKKVAEEITALAALRWQSVAICCLRRV